MVAMVQASGCATTTATSLGDGTYVVDMRGNGLTSRGEAIAEAYRRAGAICPTGYTVINQTDDARSSFVATGNVVHEVRKPEVTLVIRCGAGEMRMPDPPAPPTPDSGVVPRWWCTTLSDGEGGCMVRRSNCEELRAAALPTDPGASPCTSRASVFCFDYLPSIRGDVIRSCHPSLDACRIHRDFIATRAEPTGRPTTDCRTSGPPAAEPSVVARWWCVIAPGGFGTCEDGERRCEETRVDLARAEPSVSTCRPQAFAICFRRAVPELGELETCHTDVTSCDAYRSYALSHPEKLGVPVTACRVVD